MTNTPKGPRLALTALYTLLTLIGIAGVSSTAGCNRSLFSDDANDDSRLRYWGNDSARQTTESRRRGQTMGFGFPTGSGDQ